jgi:hypothetical protein
MSTRDRETIRPADVGAMPPGVADAPPVERGTLPNVAPEPRVNTHPVREGSARERLRALAQDPDETIALGARELARIRREAWREHAAAIATPDSAAWADLMAATHGPAVKIWHNALPWASAYLVSRYGEDVEQWPDALGDDDAARMAGWMRDLGTVAGLTPLGTRRTAFPGETLHGLDEVPAAEPHPSHTVSSVPGDAPASPTSTTPGA